MNKNKYIVYGLIDPRDGSLFYVGKSCSGFDKMKRHTQPWSLRDHNQDKNRKIMEIIDSGLSPQFQVLATARSKKDLAMKETVLIRSLSKEQPLLNMVNNRAGRSRTEEKES